jgi:hypothetical protein
MAAWCNDPLGSLIGKPGYPRRAGLVPQQPLDSLCHGPFLPAPDCSLADAGRSHDRRCAEPIGRRQHYPRPPNVLLRAIAIIDDCLKALAIPRMKMNGDTCAHSPDSHVRYAFRIQNRTLLSASFH